MRCNVVEEASWQTKPMKLKNQTSGYWKCQNCVITVWEALWSATIHTKFKFMPINYCNHLIIGFLFCCSFNFCIFSQNLNATQMICSQNSINSDSVILGYNSHYYLNHGTNRNGMELSFFLYRLLIFCCVTHISPFHSHDSISWEGSFYWQKGLLLFCFVKFKFAKRIVFILFC